MSFFSCCRHALKAPATWRQSGRGFSAKEIRRQRVRASARSTTCQTTSSLMHGGNGWPSGMSAVSMSSIIRKMCAAAAARPGLMMGGLFMTIVSPETTAPPCIRGTRRLQGGCLSSALLSRSPVVQILRGRVFYATLPSDEAACSRICRIISIRGGIFAWRRRRLSMNSRTRPSSRILTSALSLFRLSIEAPRVSNTRCTPLFGSFMGVVWELKSQFGSKITACTHPRTSCASGRCRHPANCRARPQQPQLREQRLGSSF